MLLPCTLGNAFVQLLVSSNVYLIHHTFVGYPHAWGGALSSLSTLSNGNTDCNELAYVMSWLSSVGQTSFLGILLYLFCKQVPLVLANYYYPNLVGFPFQGKRCGTLPRFIMVGLVHIFSTQV